ncbi:hypothetical protein BJY52DRAFT_1308779, partial [Lactarius psammicola]
VLGLLPSGLEMRVMLMRCIYFADHNTHTTTWSDLRLPSTVDVDALHYKLNCRRKIIYFRGQQVMCLIVDAKCDVRVRCGWV